MNVLLVDKVNFLSKERGNFLKNQTLRVLRKLDVSKGKELSITFVDDHTMRKLNADFRNINRTTDVLSFPQDGPDYTLLGDIIISTETSKRRSEKRKMNFEDEINKLIIHGILHLLGYNHKRKKESIAMKEKEKELLSLFNTF